MFTDLVADGAERMLVALVAGATRGAGRAIAVELARAGFFVDLARELGVTRQVIQKMIAVGAERRGSKLRCSWLFISAGTMVRSVRRSITGSSTAGS